MALVYSVTAAPPVDADVIARRLTVTVDGTAFDPKEYAPSTTRFDDVSVEQGAQVILALSDVDDAGNVSEPAVFEFEAVDTIPPAKPGEFGVTLVREEF